MTTAVSEFRPINRAYDSVFRPGKLSIGLVVPLERYADGPVPTMERHVERVRLAEKLGYAAVWLRDVPFNVPSFGDAGQVFDPFVYLGLLAGATERIALGVASIILPLRHPAHVAKAAASADVLSGGRLLLGVASGDRPDEYPALGIPFEERGKRFRESFAELRRLEETRPELDMLPKPVAGRLPLLITGASQQDPGWLAHHGDGWMIYPRNPTVQARIIHEWRQRLDRDKPVMQPLYIDLVDDADAAPRPIHLGVPAGCATPGGLPQVDRRHRGQPRRPQPALPANQHRGDPATHRRRDTPGVHPVKKTILITGSTDGIGRETANLLAAEGHRVLLHGRNPDKLAAWDGETYAADLSDLSQVRALADAVSDKHDHLDVLINNAGVYTVRDPVTDDGLDVRFVVNTIAPYLLTQRLLPLLGTQGRVINLSSAAQSPVDLQALTGDAGLSDGTAYAQSKLALTMWSSSLARSLGDGGPTIIAVNPGSMLGTKMVKDAYGVAGADIRIGAEILGRAALDDEFAKASGQYYDNDAGRFAAPPSDGRDPERCDAVVRAIEALLT